MGFSSTPGLRTTPFCTVLSMPGSPQRQRDHHPPPSSMRDGPCTRPCSCSGFVPLRPTTLWSPSPTPLAQSAGMEEQTTSSDSAVGLRSFFFLGLDAVCFLLTRWVTTALVAIYLPLADQLILQDPRFASVTGPTGALLRLLGGLHRERALIFSSRFCHRQQVEALLPTSPRLKLSCVSASSAPSSS